MSPKPSPSQLLFILVNLLLLGLAVSNTPCDCDNNNPPNHSSKHKHKHKHHKHKSHEDSPSSPPKPPGFPLPTSPPFVTPKAPAGFPMPQVTPPEPETCPRDALKFGACSKLLGGVVGGEIGTVPKKPCCSLFGGLVEAEAAVCLCTAIKANLLGFNLNVPLSLSFVLNACDMKTPPDFQCS